MYRILFSEQRKKFKIQRQFSYLFYKRWEDHKNHNDEICEFDTKERAIKELEFLEANDWKEVPRGN